MKRAKEGKLPKLVESKDLKGVLHVLIEYLGSLARRPLRRGRLSTKLSISTTRCAESDILADGLLGLSG